MTSYNPAYDLRHRLAEQQAERCQRERELWEPSRSWLYTTLGWRYLLVALIVCVTTSSFL